MSKKDFKAIAAAIYGTVQNIRSTEISALNPKELAEWAMGDVISRVADTLADANPRFNRGLFIEACETGKCKGMRG